MSQTLNQEPAGDGALTRRERERLRRRQAMLEAAQAVFAEKGYEQATLDEIAERAEFGKGTLYNYFEGGKEAILLAVLDEIHDGICRVIQSSFVAKAEEGPLRDAFRALVMASFDFFLAREELFMVLMKESHRLCFGEDAEHAAYLHAQQERMVGALAPALERAAARGEIRPLPPHPLAHLMLENINGMLVHRALMDRHEDCADSILHRPAEAAEMLATLFFDGIAARPQA